MSPLVLGMTPPGGARLPRAFYGRDTTVVARDLLGCRLVRVVEGRRLAGLICETEAYTGSDDRASHAFRRTPRSSIMYGPPGFAYVYFIYGMYYCLNAVAEGHGRPGAVLIRAIVPTEGVDLMRRQPARIAGGSQREIRAARLTDGPGKLCRALAITGEHNGADLVEGAGLFIEAGQVVAPGSVTATPRIGVKGDEEALRREWRFVWLRSGSTPRDEPAQGA